MGRWKPEKEKQDNNKTIRMTLTIIDFQNVQTWAMYRRSPLEE